MMLGVRFKSVMVSQPRREPERGRPDEPRGAAPEVAGFVAGFGVLESLDVPPGGLLGTCVPLWPGAIGVPPGPTRPPGTSRPDVPGATGVPPGPICPAPRVVPAAPVPVVVPGAPGAGAAPPPLVVPLAAPAAPPAPEPVAPPAAPRVPAPAAPPAPPAPPVWAMARSVVEARKAAVNAARMLCLPGIGSSRCPEDNVAGQSSVQSDSRSCGCGLQSADDSAVGAAAAGGEGASRGLTLMRPPCCCMAIGCGSCGCMTDLPWAFLWTVG